MMDRITDGFRGASMFASSETAKYYNALADLEDKIERGELVERSSGCCWCIADDIQNKTYIRTDDTEYSFIDAAFCPKCGRRLEDA